MVKKTMHDLGGSRPVPDPTILTTQQLQREVVVLRELMTTRFDGYEKAIALLQARTDKSPSIDVVAESVTSLRNVVDEKFHSIAVQFSERDTRTEQTARDSKVAIDAALKSQQEAFAEQNKSSALAIAKSEAATMKQIDQIGVTTAATTTGINDKIDDVKERLTRIEGHSKGIGDGWGVLVGAFGIIAAIAAVIALILKP